MNTLASRAIMVVLVSSESLSFCFTGIIVFLVSTDLHMGFCWVYLMLDRCLVFNWVVCSTDGVVNLNFLLYCWLWRKSEPS